jgi:hypothetical protein
MLSQHSSLQEVSLESFWMGRGGRGAFGSQGAE